MSIPASQYAQKSHLVTKNIDAPSLTNNILGIPTSQPLAVYLPPSYDTSSLRYPVVYFLPGFGDQVNYWLNGTYQNFRLNEAMDTLIMRGTIEEFIVVIANGYNFMQGSFYVNSSVTGNWEDFIIKGVVGFIDENYRTIKDATSRGISGHSMGGFGAWNLAMLHPDVFGSVFSLSPGLFDTTGLKNSQLFKSQSFINQYLLKEQEYSGMSNTDALAAFKSYIQSRMNAGDWDTPFVYAYGSAFSPNSNKVFPFIDYPYSKQGDLLVVDSTKLQNFENGFGGLRQKVSQYKENLLNLNAIGIDYGLNDEYRWITKGCKYLSDLLTAEGITHQSETFNGGHQDQVRNRIEGYLLPFFSKNLKFDESAPSDMDKNPTSPEEFNLYPNYPNPFNPSTTISYLLSANGHVELKVFNVQTKEVKTLVCREQQAGNYKVNFVGNNLSSGVYFCRLNALGENGKKYSKVVKMVMVK